MAFRSDDQDYRWPKPGESRDDRHSPASRDRDLSSDSLSLVDTLRELAFTIAGFVSVILLIIAAVHFVS
jgi:hypothetical protein